MKQIKRHVEGSNISLAVREDGSVMFDGFLRSPSHWIALAEMTFELFEVPPPPVVAPPCITCLLRDLRDREAEEVSARFDVMAEPDDVCAIKRALMDGCGGRK